MEWFDENGETMSIERWTNPSHRTLQYLAASTPEIEEFNRILLIVHGNETPIDVTLPQTDEVERYVSLWSSAEEAPNGSAGVFVPGDVLPVVGTSMHLFRAE